MPSPTKVSQPSEWNFPCFWSKSLHVKVYNKVCVDSTQAKLIKPCTSCCSRGPLHLQQVLRAPQSLIKVLPEGPSTHFPNTCIFCLQRHLLRQLPLALQPRSSQLLAQTSESRILQAAALLGLKHSSSLAYLEPGDGRAQGERRPFLPSLFALLQGHNKAQPQPQLFSPFISFLATLRGLLEGRKFCSREGRVKEWQRENVEERPDSISGLPASFCRGSSLSCFHPVWALAIITGRVATEHCTYHFNITFDPSSPFPLNPVPWKQKLFLWAMLYPSFSLPCLSIAIYTFQSAAFPSTSLISLPRIGILSSLPL